MEIEKIFEDERNNSGRIRFYFQKNDTLAAYEHSAFYLSLLFSEVQLYKGHCFDTKIEYRFTVVDMTFIDTLPEFLRLEVSDDHIDLLINTD